MRIVLSIAILSLFILAVVGGYLYVTKQLPSLPFSSSSDTMTATEKSDLSNDYPGSTTGATNTALTDGTDDSDLEEDDQLIEMHLKELDTKVSEVDTGLGDKAPDLTE